MSDETISRQGIPIHASWTENLEQDLLRQLKDERLQSEQLRLLGTAIHVAGLGIAILTPAVEADGPRISFVNDGFCEIYGRQREEIIGQTASAFSVIERQQTVFDELLMHLFNGSSFEAETTARRKDGTEFELEVQIVPVLEGGLLTHWVAFVRDVTEYKNQVHQLRHQAFHDALTDLPNRTLLMDRLEKAVDHARDEDGIVALLLMDLDRFKEVNDTFGHHFGDVLLKQVAFRLRNQMASGDTVARLGGDEFAIVLSDARDSSTVAGTARRIINALQQPFVVDGQVLEVGASIGIAVYPQHGADIRALLRRADVAMYAAKQTQIGYAFHKEDLETRTPDDMALVVDMRHALEHNEFELHYQPKLHLRSGLITRVEVLLRWNHPQRGQLSPALFIPIAERTGLIRPITDWILDRALQQCNEWQKEGAPVHLAINVSAKSMLEQTLPAKVNAALEKWQIDPRFLKLEITESCIMADPAHALAIMSMLQSMGVRLSVDDFGTGYSSLTHLRQLPIDEIKIDQSFVTGMVDNDADAAIVHTVVDLGHNLGKQVCAEGVEHEDTAKLLRQMNCDLAQGFWISKPLSAPDLMTWLAETCWGLKVKTGGRTNGSA